MDDFENKKTCRLRNATPIRDEDREALRKELDFERGYCLGDGKVRFLTDEGTWAYHACPGCPNCKEKA